MTESEAQTPAPAPRRSWVGRLQDRLARQLGVSASDQATTVATMLARGRSRPFGYWLQLVLAMGIATFGLLLGSTAVVIGAMLVSPLMSPIIELGMGLAIGSPLLVVRTGLRLAISVVVVVLSAAALTVVVPIHDVTSEIAARTSPNLLDLAIASFCALAGVYAAIRADGEATTTAAGTAIGIALVPPLCVVGFGLGTRSSSIAAGAALLFTANLCAILFLSVVAFMALGYGRVDVARLERTQRDAREPGFVREAARKLSAFFSSKLGPAARVAMPLLFVAVVFVPLRSALREVTWELSARKAAKDALADIAPETIEVSVKVERHRLYMRLIAIASGAGAERLRQRLVDRVTKATGVIPDVEVLAVPDAEALARSEAALRDRSPVPAPPPATSAVPAELGFVLVQKEVEAALRSWPAGAAGALDGWTLSMTSRGRARIDVFHFGAPLGRAATDMLAADLAARLERNVVVEDVALDEQAHEGSAARDAARAAASILQRFPDADSLFACVEGPAGETSDLGPRDPRVVVKEARRSKFHWSRTGCNEGAAPPPDAGVDGNSPVP